MEQTEDELEALRTEWRGTIQDIDAHIRRLDSGLQVNQQNPELEDATHRWRVMLVAWRDELMGLLREHPKSTLRLPLVASLACAGLHAGAEFPSRVAGGS